MKIAVMGAGAIGAYFGGRLAVAGEEVHFIARGPHLHAMREKGLQVYSPLGDFHTTAPILTDDPKTVGKADIILFCVKLWDTDAVVEQIKPMIGPDTGIYSFQNGVHAEVRLAELLGAKHVIGGYAATPATIIEPGVVRQYGTWATLEFGELDNRRTPRVEAFLKACLNANIDALIAEDIQKALWSKFVFITTHSGATALCRAPEGPIRRDPWGKKLLHGLATEAVQVARAKQVNLPEDYAEHVLEQVYGLPDAAQGSLATDVLLGNRLELEWLSGTITKYGAELGVPTPSHDAVMMGLNLHALGPAKA
jgi:2-dehydropantoate 2-reductase